MQRNNRVSWSQLIVSPGRILNSNKPVVTFHHLGEVVGNYTIIDIEKFVQTLPPWDYYEDKFLTIYGYNNGSAVYNKLVDLLKPFDTSNSL